MTTITITKGNPLADSNSDAGKWQWLPKIALAALQ